MYKNLCDTSFHMHYHGVRGLSFNPKISDLGALACHNTVCTKSKKYSCWPRPRFADGYDWGTTVTDMYTCTGAIDLDMQLHIVGNFKGSIYSPADISYAGSGGCTATSKDGIVRISAFTLSWCNIRLGKFPPGTNLVESGKLRNVCEA